MRKKMSGKIALRSPTVNKRLLHDDGGGGGGSSSRSRSSRSTTRGSDSVSSFAEVAGGTAAECAAVCCCCPCGLLNLLVLAFYKVPAGLFRKMWKAKRKRQLIKKGLLPKQKRCKAKCGCHDFDSDLQIHPVVDLQKQFSDVANYSDESDERKVMELEKEMWERFYSAGFWRSTSRRELGST